MILRADDSAAANDLLIKSGVTVSSQNDLF